MHNLGLVLSVVLATGIFATQASPCRAADPRSNVPSSADQMFSSEYTTFVTARTNFERVHVLDPTWTPPLSYSAIWHMQRVGRGWSANALSELDTARELAERPSADKSRCRSTPKVDQSIGTELDLSTGPLVA